MKQGHKHKHRRKHKHRHEYGSESRKYLLIIMAVGIVLLGIGAVWLTAVSIPVYRERKAIEARIKAKQESEAIASGELPAGTIVYNGKTYKPDPVIHPLLLLGVDTSGAMEEKDGGGNGGQSDGIAVAAWNVATEEIKLLLIPRDTMTEIRLFDVSGNELGTDVQHITLAFGYGDGREKSCELVEEAVSKLLLDLPIDGYMAVNVEAIPILNDAVGGVSVTVEDEELAKAKPQFPLGEEIRLLGEDAEQYLRYRNVDKTQSAIGRMDRHKDYAEGWIQAARAEGQRNSDFVPELFEALESYMITDLNKDEYLKVGMSLVNSSQSLGEEQMITLPGEGRQGIIYDEYIPDEEAVKQLVLDMFYKEVN